MKITLLYFNFLLLTAFLNFSTSSSELGIEQEPDKVEIVKMGRTSSSILDPKKIDILVWNQYKGKNDDWLLNFKLLKQNREILILQESLLEKPMLTEYTLDPFFEHIMAISFGKTGVSIASTVKASSYFPILTKTREGHMTTRKVTLLTYYPLKNCNRPLLVLSIHGINVVTHSANRKQLRQIFEEIENFDGPVIFAGDFNSWAQKRLKFLFNIMNEYSFTDVTFSPDDRMRTFGHIIDHIFLRGFKATKSKVWGELEGSDHKAMTATLTMDDYSWCHN